ncbi:alternative ribosome rescue aminoacyl-tRNA hydrolase ArfB [Maribacter chungangensis]|uniref:Alternative ribosome rescue aminoacyl-tRNA hydrolase ArfB n=1 Tax=Maribacter chungangensis TaxID=1069117 RepID=A0ABW3B8D7_9FLAO
MDRDIILQELQFKAVRSSGPGGQHANKVSSKVEVSFDVQNSNGLSEREKSRLLLKLKSKLSKNGLLVLQCDESRSQHSNKSIVIKRLLSLLDLALIIPKKRKPSKPSRSSIEKRLKSKKKAALKKANRSKPRLD